MTARFDGGPVPVTVGRPEHVRRHGRTAGDLVGDGDAVCGSLDSPRELLAR